MLTTTATRAAVAKALLPGPRLLAAIGAAILVSTALPLAAPVLTRRFVDGLIAGVDLGDLSLIAVGYVALTLGGQCATLVTTWLASAVAWDGGNRLRERVTGHTLRLDMGFHGRRSAGEMIERVDGDVVAIADFVAAFLLDVVAGALLLAGVVVVVVTVDPLIGCALLLCYAAIAVGMVRAQRRAVPSASHTQQQSAELFGLIEERVAGLEDIRANGAGPHTLRGLHRANAAIYWAWYRSERIGSAVVAATSVAFAVGTALVLGLAAWGRSSGTITIGTAVLLFQYTLMVRVPLERLIDQLKQYQRALAGVSRVAELLAERPGLAVPARPAALPSTGPLGVRLESVHFAYGERDVLSDVSLELEPGETLGLVGRTGSGKTTIGRLVLRLHDPRSGTVVVGGHDLRTVDPGQLRQRVCAVPQDVHLFGGTVRENLTLFRTPPEDEELRALLENVGLGAWLAALPDGLDTVLSGTGSMSTGEAQLLAFARVFLTDPGLVVLDEPSSRLDPATEQSLVRASGLLLAGRTGILIAHRLSSLATVDKIAVMEGGRVVEHGRRADLVADPSSRFSRLLELAR